MTECIDLRAFLTRELRELRTTMKNSDSILPRLQWYIACQALGAALQSRKEKAPAKIQHWVPNSYIRRFAVPLEPPMTARAMPRLWELSVSSNKRRIVMSSEFAHKPIEGKGFYAKESEVFFSRIEGGLCETVMQLQQGEHNRFQVITAAAMMLIHEVRAPQTAPVTQFKKRTFHETVNAVGKMIDSLPELHVYFEEPDEKLPFTTFRTIRKRQLHDGQIAWYFPAAPHIAVTASERKLSRKKREAIVKAGRAGAIAMARRNDGVTLYGLTIEELQPSR